MAKNKGLKSLNQEFRVFFSVGGDSRKASRGMERIVHRTISEMKIKNWVAEVTDLSGGGISVGIIFKAKSDRPLLAKFMLNVTSWMKTNKAALDMVQ